MKFLLRVRSISIAVVLTVFCIFAYAAEPPSQTSSPAPVLESQNPNAADAAHWHRPDGSHLPFQDDASILDFLRTARVVSSKQVGEGINQTRKLLLERDGIQMHAAFRNVHKDHYYEDENLQNVLRNHRDDCGFEVAAYKLSRMLGLDIVPPTVMREIDGQKGSLQAWVETALMEKERRTRGIDPPDEWRWIAQMLTMHLFDNLVGNYDRHQGNLLIDADWEIWLIDHTQAFRRFRDLHTPEKLLYCDRTVWQNLQRLDKRTLEREFKGLLRDAEIQAMLARRDKIIKQIQSLIREKGEGSVLFDLKG